MQNLDTFEARTAATLQFLQHNAQYQADVTMTLDDRRRPDDMEIDALTKKDKGYKGNEKSKTDAQKTTCFVCGRVGHMSKESWFKENEEGQCIQQQGQERLRQWQRKEQCEGSHDSNGVDDFTSANLGQSNLESDPGRHLGPSRPHR